MSIKNDKGFSLVEQLVIILVIGILASIGVASWNQLIRRMEVRATNSLIQAAINKTKSKARTEKVSYFLYLDKQEQKYAIAKRGTSLVEANWQKLPHSKTVTVEWSGINLLNRYSVASFDWRGTVEPLYMGRFVSSHQNIKSCVGIATLLGATISAEGDKCTSEW